jgi:hypothetical protein
MATKIRHDWTKLDPLIDHLKAQGWNDTQIAKDLRIGRQTLVDHLRSREPGTPIAHPSTPVHQGTLEEYQEVIEEVHQSVPDAPRISPDEVHLSTPIVHPEVSPDDSALAHSGVPARGIRHQCPCWVWAFISRHCRRPRNCVARGSRSDHVNVYKKSTFVGETLTLSMDIWTCSQKALAVSHHNYGSFPLFEVRLSGVRRPLSRA